VMEYRRFPPGESVVSTFEFHEHRERAPHLEQSAHRGRLLVAERMVRNYLFSYSKWKHVRVTDLGCGDGGLLQLMLRPEVDAIGYDFQPSNEAGWRERGVNALACDFTDFNIWVDVIRKADIYVMSEVLEHLEEPRTMVRRVANRGAALVASSPYHEHEGSIDGCHNWAWDVEGYQQMLTECGMKVVNTELVSGWSQVHLAVPA
jgi:2-polyprenyl-3-methyl-5-hydroxy-6-metoxy-1,4-benzoquinol methylase